MTDEHGRQGVNLSDNLAGCIGARCIPGAEFVGVKADTGIVKIDAGYSRCVFDTVGQDE